MATIIAKGQSEISLGTYDTQEGMLTLAEWVELYYKKTGRIMNIGTMRKRRAVANIGYLIPPKTYLLSREDFEKVADTPLPMCQNVIKGAR